MDIFGNFIDGEWTSSQQTAPNINPSDIGDVIGEVSLGSVADVDAAISSAKAAFPGWAGAQPFQRGLILKKVATELEARHQEFGHQLAREEGKTLSEAKGEIMRAAQIFDFYAGETTRITGELADALRPGVTAEVTYEPVGIIGVITPWNFPIAIPAWKIAAALAYGNCVVFKPSEVVPATAQELVRIVMRAGLPKGVLNMVMGEGHIVGRRLVEHRDVPAISFTGSVPTGRQIVAGAAGAETFKRLQLEMGGKNPLIVLDDADLNVAVEVAIDGAFLATGQRCTASSRLIVTKGIHDRFVERMIERLGQLRVGHALAEDTHIGPVVDQRQLEIDENYISIGRDEGARLAFGGQRLTRETRGYFLEPALFVEATADMRICREEIFGPVAAVIAAGGYDEALAIANDTPFGLSAGICTTSLKHAAHFKRHADAGIVKVNISTCSVDFHLPAGGRKMSAHGPGEQGRHAREFYTQTKTAYQLG